ncbi:DUF6285 domain-containing protein [Sulfitobacter sp. F26169L]|uniref:DUF6285 domain-containing protein n=1 Tax=Sulfitobacter sp. F26169L TaxID=2996015 RepID=UPI002260AD47|nr:DUF6285 domain-containing protein [Sulfitobacter sp. F26169L]MCX7567925.1 DUF6285 domain-containing protein [Sulfitobacter sp. F26169L]
MQDAPEPDDILGAVTKWLRGTAVAALPPHASFEAKVAAAAIDLVRREIAARNTATEEAARLSAILGMQGDLDNLTRTLCARIDEGTVDLSTPELADVLIASTLDKISIDQPDFSAVARLRRLASGA